MRVVVVLLVSCGDLGDPARKAEPPPVVAITPDAAPPVMTTDAPVGPSSLKIRWLSVNETSTCFYFSGPRGRDDVLVGKVTFDRPELGDGAIAIKINNATFRGSYRDHKIVVRRSSQHDFGGPWNIDEVIQGEIVDGAFTGTYAYRECEQDGACPGTCQIDARIRFER